MKSKAFEEKIQAILCLEDYLVSFVPGIRRLKLSDDAEYVTIIFKGGAQKKVCIACDSNMAILKDIAKALN